MILLIDTSSPLCRIEFFGETWHHKAEWQADRNLAKGLLSYLQEQLREVGKDWNDITGIGAFRGPGSFTGLRIGLTVVNTIADSKQVPIVGSSSENWQDECLQRLRRGENDRLVMPLYGGEAHITKPRK